MIPNGWKENIFLNIADYMMGFAFKSSDFVEDGIPLIRMSNLYQNTLNLNRSAAYLPTSFLNEYSRFIIKPQDILVSMTGTMGKEDYGFAVIVPENHREMLLNQRVARIRAKKENEQAFILYLMRSRLFLNQIYSIPGGTKQANISSKDLGEIRTITPPLKPKIPMNL